ncbi:MAG: amidohydrolase family protein, partial [Synechococcus sp. SB0677_bin_5]|nr:amidohydrolase family protein [Synechococcus sp. SB0677_bin_5]
MATLVENDAWRGQDLVVHNGLILQPDGRLLRGGLVIRDGRIRAIEADITADPDLPCLDAGGRHVLPGVVDPQVHFRDPGLVHKEDLITASRACLRGGVTSFLEMPNTRPPPLDRPPQNAQRGRAAEVSRVHYGFFLGACG